MRIERSEGRRRLRWGVAAAVMVVGSVLALADATGARGQTGHAANAVKTDVDVSGPFLQNLTNDPHSAKSANRCGEPQLNQDVSHPDTLYMSCTSSDGLNYQTPAPGSVLTWSYFDPTKKKFVQPCYTFVSHDGGDSWSIVDPAPDLSDVLDSCGDALAAQGPNGEMYLGGDAVHYPADGKDAPTYRLFAGLAPDEPLGIGFTRSLDGGKSWSTPSLIPTANDRPWLTVDQSTGTIYEESGCVVYDPATKIGPYGCTPSSRSLAVSTDQGRTWTPDVDIHNTQPPAQTLTPGRLHNISLTSEVPQVGEANIDSIAAAQGVVATAGVNDGNQAVFAYSTDRGTTFAQRQIPLGNSMPCPTPTVGGMAGDPNHRGSFAVMVLCTPNARAVRVFVTHNLGTSWTETADLGVAPPPDYNGNPSPFGVNRPWIAYGPTGALGVMWRQNYGTGPYAAFGNDSPGPQDVFAAISADGGTTFGQPVRVNTAASPTFDPRAPYFDDTSYILLDKHYAYVAWGDWRSGEMQVWLRKVPIPHS